MRNRGVWVIALLLMAGTSVARPPGVPTNQVAQEAVGTHRVPIDAVQDRDTPPDRERDLNLLVHPCTSTSDAAPAPDTKPSLAGFAPEFGGKADDVQSTQFPNPVGPQGVTQWLDSTAAGMKGIATLNLGTEDQKHYDEIEFKTCGTSLYCRISVAEQAIRFRMSKSHS